MSLENWKSLFEMGGVVLLFLTFVAGAGALYFSNRINAVQNAQLRHFDKDLTDAKTALGIQQERAANADARVAGLERDAADAKKEMAKQEERAANAEKAASDAALALTKFKEPRTLTPGQQKRISHNVRAFTGTLFDLAASK